MTVQLPHQRLAKAHHFAIALALGVKVRAALAAAHRQGGEGILEGLFKGEEFEDREVDRGVKAHPTLVRADGRAVLDAEGAVDLGLAPVIDPGNAELEGALGFDQTLK